MKIAIEGKVDGDENMAMDRELLQRAETGGSAARIYEWDGAWVSLGKFQHPEIDLLEPKAVPWVMRPTGGKAVLHGHDITVSIAKPLSKSRSLRQVYRDIITPLVTALQRCGENAALGEDTRFLTKHLRTADCFRHISPNDVVGPETGRKLIGCALRITRHAVLAQCSIPLTMPLIDPSRIYANAHVAMPLEVDKDLLTKEIANALSSL